MKYVFTLWPLVAVASVGSAASATTQDGPPGGRPDFRPPSDPLVAALDVDEDGTLSKAEWAKAAASLLKLDSNEDGNLTVDELAPRDRGDRRRRRGPRMGFRSPILTALDLDLDGALFEDEVTEAADRLAGLDANRDDVLDLAELRPEGRGGSGPPGGRRGRGRGGFRGRGQDAEPVEDAPEPEDLDPKDGVASIPDRETYERLSYQGKEVMIDTSLAGIEFVKFTVTDAESDAPKIYFINTETHRAHPAFAGAVGLGGGRGRGSGQMRGVLSYRPFVANAAGEPGLYTFEFNPGDSFSSDEIELAFNLLRTKAPVVDGRLSFYALPAMAERVEEEANAYETKGIPLFSPEEDLKKIAFLPLHHAVGFGRLVHMTPGDRPGVRDVVVCSVLPNEMPRVAGVITGVRQTPLSHVNLRAIQDNVPNAYIRGAAELEDVKNLIDKYVRYEVTASGYSLREATAEEVNAHFEELRPESPQSPVRDLSPTSIRSLDALAFADADSVGVKAANLAALRKMDLPEGMVPNGMAVPFSYYDAFMRQNGFYEMATGMLADDGFRGDRATREAALAAFREAIEHGIFPSDLKEALGAAQEAFKGRPIRCRSSTNNEDLPGFSGAGLYDSYTHRPDEGHLAKSIKQVYASLWNFRAFEERDFYRVDHLTTSMGVLLHDNADDEIANGVAVTEDVLYGTKDIGPVLYYVNAQVGETLVTNPDSTAVPEEILMGPRNPATDRVMRESSLVAPGEQVLSDEKRLALRRALRVVEKGFRTLYEATDDGPFAMEVEFKVLSDGRLSIKQARPWVF